jgi:hypothetical protein
MTSWRCLSVLAVLLLGACGESRESQRARVLKNLRLIADYEKEGLRREIPYDFVPLDDIPNSQPWSAPAAPPAAPALGLLVAPDGKLHERYEARVDPRGVDVPVEFLIDGKSGKIQPTKTERRRIWCEISAVGKFGDSAGLARMGIRLEIQIPDYTRGIPEGPLSVSETPIALSPIELK